MWGAAGVALFALGGLTWLALAILGFPGIEHKDTVPVDTLLNVLKLVFAVVAGAGALVALVMGYRRQRVAEAQNVLAKEAGEREHTREGREQSRVLNERFATASGQLGHDKAAVRLAGVYAMAGLADDWYEHRQTCISVLCATLRMPYAPGPSATPEPDLQGRTHHRLRQRREPGPTEELLDHWEVRQTVIRCIRAHLLPRSARSWQGYDFDFTGTVFDSADFSDADFSGGTVTFRGATFSGGVVNFRDAKFSGADVDFRDAKFSSGTVTFDGAEFSNGLVAFGGAEFSDGWAAFRKAKFSGGSLLDFREAKFSGGKVSFMEATFSKGKVAFDKATFSKSDVMFSLATFSDGTVSFRKATFSGGTVTFFTAAFSGSEVSFRKATFSGGTVTFSTVASWERPPMFDDGVLDNPPAGLLLPSSPEPQER